MSCIDLILKRRSIRKYSSEPVPEEVRAKVMEMEGFLGGKGRIVLRPSGTEPLIRIMVEAEEQDLVNQVIGELSRVIEEKCGE